MKGQPLLTDHLCLNLNSQDFCPLFFPEPQRSIPLLIASRLSTLSRYIMVSFQLGATPFLFMEAIQDFTSQLVLNRAAFLYADISAAEAGVRRRTNWCTGLDKNLFTISVRRFWLSSSRSLQPRQYCNKHSSSGAHKARIATPRDSLASL